VQGHYKFRLPAGQDMIIKVKKKESVRAHTQLAILARLAFTSPAKIVTIQMTFIVRVSKSGD
jgi:hypothetical protein